MCRYLEKVLPSPYGPRLPWWFPCSHSYWATGDVEDNLNVAAALKQSLTSVKQLLRLNRDQEEAVSYQQVLKHTAHDTVNVSIQCEECHSVMGAWECLRI